MLDYYKAYVKMGFKPIALFKNSKCPIGKKWNENWDCDYWEKYFHTDQYNIGILLGDIIDVEGDTQEGNDLLSSIIRDLPHPMYKSYKSIHHLFLCPKNIIIDHLSFNGIEFRGHKHQSAMPPSIHEKGARYNWLASSKFPIPYLPQELVDFYLVNKKPNKTVVSKNSPKRGTKKGYIKTICNKCKSKFFINKKRLALEVKSFRYLLEQKWECRSCRTVDLRIQCKKIKNAD